jgi:hypothetical protein
MGQKPNEEKKYTFHSRENTVLLETWSRKTQQEKNHN